MLSLRRVRTRSPLHTYHANVKKIAMSNMKCLIMDYVICYYMYMC